jgi:hypothetical protein
MMIFIILDSKTTIILAFEFIFKRGNCRRFEYKKENYFINVRAPYIYITRMMNKSSRKISGGFDASF